MLTSKQKEILALVIETLIKNNVEFQVTGGIAALYYGANRHQFDIDIDVYKRDREKIGELFREYIIEDWNNDLELNDPFDIWIMKLKIDGVLVDFSQIEDSYIVSPAGERFKQAETLHPQIVTFEGVTFPIQPKEELIAYKEVVGRDIDFKDIEKIDKKG